MEETARELDLWKRIVAKRKRDCTSIDEGALDTIATEAWERYPLSKDNTEGFTSLQKIERCLGSHLSVCFNERSRPSNLRRDSWNAVKELLQRIDEKKAMARTADIAGAKTTCLVNQGTLSSDPITDEDDVRISGVPHDSNIHRQQQGLRFHAPEHAADGAATANRHAHLEYGYRPCMNRHGQGMQQQQELRNGAADRASYAPFQPQRAVEGFMKTGIFLAQELAEALGPAVALSRFHLEKIVLEKPRKFCWYCHLCCVAFDFHPTHVQIHCKEQKHLVSLGNKQFAQISRSSDSSILPSQVQHQVGLGSTHHGGAENAGMPHAQRPQPHLLFVPAEPTYAAPPNPLNHTLPRSVLHTHPGYAAWPRTSSAAQNSPSVANAAASLSQAGGRVEAHSNCSAPAKNAIVAMSPKPANVGITIMAPADLSPAFAFSFAPRRNVTTQVTCKHSLLPPDLLKSTFLRLRQWDPFWVDCITLGAGRTSKVHDTKPITGLIRTAAQINFSISQNDVEKLSGVSGVLAGLRWGQEREAGPWKSKEAVMLLRMLPLVPVLGEKRADCHLWPKATLVQINGKPVAVIQRKQQSHNYAEWKGMCRELNMTEHVADPFRCNWIQIFAYDDQPYIYTLSICRFRSVEEVTKGLVNPASKQRLNLISCGVGRGKAIDFAKRHETVAIDSGDDDSADVGKFIFTLTCPISKTILKTPVRGKLCKHWQCFDLNSYLSSNVPVSGSRWRCAVCESFVSIADLELCGLTYKMLKEFRKEASADRDRIEFSAIGTYRLLEARRLRFAKQRSDEGAPMKRQEVSDADIIDLM